MKALSYLGIFLKSFVPRFFFKRRLRELEGLFFDVDPLYIEGRVDYYCKLTEPFLVDSGFKRIKDIRMKGQSSYYFDLKEFLNYFPGDFRLNFRFGDEAHIESVPTLFKARPIDGENSNSVLFKLNKRRHFRFVKDPLRFSEKKSKVVFRGNVTQPHRVFFMRMCYGKPLVDAGQINPSFEHPEWQKSFMPVSEQLKYKFIVCLEGNDVASNLKWVMSSNSIAVTPKMRFETWFMEGRLEAGKHYIEVKDDYSDLEEKINYYLDRPQKAQEILNNAHDHVSQFMDLKLEELICIKTLERYFELSGQTSE